MGLIFRGSLVLRLWITLSLLAIGFSGLALGTYTWLAVSDSVASAQQQSENKIRVIQSSRFSLPNNDPLPYEQDLANQLGIRDLHLFGLNGRELAPVRFGPLAAGDTAQEAKFISTATLEKPARRTVEILKDSFRDTDVTPTQVIRGGTFGEQYAVVVPAPNVPGGLVRMSFVVQYPDVSHDAWTIVERSAWVALAVDSLPSDWPAPPWLLPVRLLTGGPG